MKSITLLGATGSVGTQALAVLTAARLPVTALSCGANSALLHQLSAAYPHATLAHGEEATLALASQPTDLLILGIPGKAGYLAFRAALGRARAIAFATKEVLLYGGRALVEEARNVGTTLIPLDSEMEALERLLSALPHSDITAVYLPATGGALRDVSLAALPTVSPADALRHPVYHMGTDITLHSATLANKAFEVYEAHCLFDLPLTAIHAVIHPEGLLHAGVALTDCSLRWHSATADMRYTIERAFLAHRLIPHPVLPPQPPLTLPASYHLTAVDPARYPVYPLLISAFQAGQAAAAYEAALASHRDFLAGAIRYTDIAPTITQRLT